MKMLRYERGLMDRLRGNVGSKADRRRRSSSCGRSSALSRLRKGAWKWYAANLDPWEHSGSSYFGASLACWRLKCPSAWPALSMNKRRPAASMEALFMQDAATAFASLALLEFTS
jgi:hypothetical protein